MVGGVSAEASFAYLVPGAGTWCNEVRAALARLAPPPEIVVCAGFEDFLRRPRQTGVACVLADTRQADLPARRLALELTALRPQPSLVLLAERPTVEEAVACMKAGASDFLELPAERERIPRSCALALDQARRRDELRRRLESLQERFGAVSAREGEVLSLLVEGRSSKSIATLLNLSKRTVDYHRGQLMTKVGVESSLELVSLMGELRYLRARDGSEQNGLQGE